MAYDATLGVDDSLAHAGAVRNRSRTNGTRRSAPEYADDVAASTARTAASFHFARRVATPQARPAARASVRVPASILDAATIFFVGWVGWVATHSGVYPIHSLGFMIDHRATPSLSMSGLALSLGWAWALARGLRYLGSRSRRAAGALWMVGAGVCGLYIESLIWVTPVARVIAVLGALFGAYLVTKRMRRRGLATP
jgi:hypothetical protein